MLYGPANTSSSTVEQLLVVARQSNPGFMQRGGTLIENLAMNLNDEATLAGMLLKEGLKARDVALVQQARDMAISLRKKVTDLSAKFNSAFNFDTLPAIGVKQPTDIVSGQIMEAHLMIESVIREADKFLNNSEAVKTAGTTSQTAGSGPSMGQLALAAAGLYFLTR